MVNFVSISGGAGSGKNTVTSHLRKRFSEEWYDARDFSFAGPLKDALSLWFGWDRRRLDYDHGYKESATLDDGSPDPYCQAFGKTRREIMQVFGIESLRDGWRDDFWIVMADLGLRLNKIQPADLFIISDARMINELEWVRKLNGYEILMHRAECPRGSDPTQINYGITLTHAINHASEQEFLTWTDYDEKIVNLVDHNKNEIANLHVLTEHLDIVTIPAIRQHFNMLGKGKHDPSLYR